MNVKYYVEIAHQLIWHRATLYCYILLFLLLPDKQMVAALVIAATANLIKSGTRLRHPSQGEWSFIVLVGIFLFYAAVSSFWAVNSEASLLRIAKFLLLLSFAMIFWFTPVYDNNKSIRPFYYLSASILFSILIATYFIAVSPIIGIGPTILYSNPIILIFSLTMPILIFATKEFHNSELLAKFTPVAICISYLLLTTLSYSESSIVAVVMGCVVIALVLYFPNAGTIISRYSAILVVVGMPFYVLIISNLPTEFMSSEFMNAASGTARIKIWLSYVEAIKQSPIWGWGLEASPNFNSNLLAASGLDYSNLNLINHPHNAFIQIWVDLGLVGALLVTLIVLSIHAGIERQQKKDRAYLLGFFWMVITISSISHGAYQGWWIAALFLLAKSFPKRA